MVSMTDSRCQQVQTKSAFMFSSTYRIQASTSFLPLSTLRDTTRTKATQCSSRPFSRFLSLRPFSTVVDAKDSSNEKDAENASNDVAGDDRNTLFVGRLPHGIGRWPLRRMLQRLFDPFGPIISLKVGEPHFSTGRSATRETYHLNSHRFAGQTSSVCAYIVREDRGRSRGI